VTSAATKVWFVPTFEPDARFVYRKADVGASISPVIGACLVRLVRIGGAGTTVDPTCGSGTLLIERALLDDDVKLAGIDVSPTAVRAASENVAAAGLQSRITILHGDAADPAKWPKRCNEVIANLPFGGRSASMDRDLKALYRQIVDNIAAILESGGRALLYTANARLLEPEIERHRDRLQLIETRVITAGGMSVRVWLLRGR
jgi:23S rRNA G2445 N2-methylase RlmL